MPKAKVWSPGPGLWIVYCGPVAYRFFDTWREAMECAVRGPLGDECEDDGCPIFCRQHGGESNVILSVN